MSRIITLCTDLSQNLPSGRRGQSKVGIGRSQLSLQSLPLKTYLLRLNREYDQCPETTENSGILYRAALGEHLYDVMVTVHQHAGVHDDCRDGRERKCEHCIRSGEATPTDAEPLFDVQPRPRDCPICRSVSHIAPCGAASALTGAGIAAVCRLMSSSIKPVANSRIIPIRITAILITKNASHPT